MKRYSITRQIKCIDYVQQMLYQNVTKTEKKRNARTVNGVKLAIGLLAWLDCPTVREWVYRGKTSYAHGQATHQPRWSSHRPFIIVSFV